MLKWSPSHRLRLHRRQQQQKTEVDLLESDDDDIADQGEGRQKSIKSISEFRFFNKHFSVFFAGALDTTTVHILPKSQIGDNIVRKPPMKMLNQPFEKTFRLQVRSTT